MPLNAQSNLNATEVMEELLENYHSKHAKQYASEFMQYRTIEQNGKYIDFVANIGLTANVDYSPKNFKSLYNIKATTTKNISRIVSDLFDESGNKLEYSSSYYYTGIDIKKKIKQNYHNIDFNILENIVRISIQSPLNKQKAEFFEYKITKESQNSKNDNIIEIHFENKDIKSVKNTRILASGKIVYNKTKGFTEQINFDKGYRDYTGYDFLPKVDLGQSVTEAEFEIKFKLKNGVIYPQSATYIVDWIDAKEPVSYYINTVNPRVNPIETNVIYREKIVFTNSVSLTKEQIKSVSLDKTGSYGNSVDGYAPFHKEIWDNVVFSELDYEKVKKDLSIGGETLLQQAQRNNGEKLPSETCGLNYEPEYLEQMKEYKIKYEANKEKYYRQVIEAYYPVLFGKKYKYNVLNN